MKLDFVRTEYKYGGKTLDSKPHGIGILMKKNTGAIYEGLFKNGEFQWGMVLELNP